MNKRDASDMLFIICLIAITAGSLYSMYIAGKEAHKIMIVVDCHQVEISPDYPTDIRERCRDQSIKQGK